MPEVKHNNFTDLISKDISMKLKDILIDLEEAKKCSFRKALALAAGLATATIGTTSCADDLNPTTIEAQFETGVFRHVKEENRKYILQVYDAAEKLEVDPLLMIALVKTESNFNPTVSSGDDYGLFQLNSNWHPQHKNNITSHIIYGINFYKQLLNRFKNRDKALRYYNTGNANPTTAGNAYVAKVIEVYNQLK